MLRIAVLGGTGYQGSGLAMRWAKAGHEVMVGSRTLDKAREAAREMNALVEGVPPLVGLENPEAAAQGQVVVLSVPYNSQLGILGAVQEHLADKVLISVVVPLKPPQVGRVWRPAANSAAEEAQALLGKATPVVAAFQNIGAGHLRDLDHEIKGDVLVCGDHQRDKQLAIQLAADAGMRGIDAGPLANASVVEGMTALLIGINKRYRVKGAGIRVTGLGE